MSELIVVEPGPTSVAPPVGEETTRSAECSGTAEPFIAAVQGHLDSAEVVAEKLVSARAADRVFRGGPLKERKIVRNLWEACLLNREFLCGDAADVCVEILRAFLGDDDIGDATILLEGFSRISCSITASSTEKAGRLVHLELLTKPEDLVNRCSSNKKINPKGETYVVAKRSFASWLALRVPVWIDMFRQFQVFNAELDLWLQAREVLMKDGRWKVVAEISNMCDDETLLINILMAEPISHSNAILVATPSLTTSGKLKVFHQLVAVGCSRLADRIRRLCSLGQRPDHLQRSLQLEFVEQLCRVGFSVRSTELASSSIHSERECEVTNDGNQRIHGLSRLAKAFDVEVSSIHVVDSGASLACFMAAVSKPGHTCGLDCEWQPGDHRVSILQVALRDEVWILDLMWAWRAGETRIADALYQLFSCTSLVKVGFAFQEDLDRLATSLPLSQDCTDWVVDPYAELRKDNNGLAALVQSTLGLNLQKDLQCSSWASRPLAQAQLQYAAADVACLPLLYSEMCDRLTLGQITPRVRVEVDSWQGESCSCLTISHVRAAVESLGIDACFQETSRAVEYEPGNVVCFVIKPEATPIAIVTKSHCRVLLDDLAAILCVSKKRIDLATRAQCIELFGFPPGLLPPLGLRSGVQVWLHESLRGCAGKLVFSSGSDDMQLVCTVPALEACFGRARWIAANHQSQTHISSTISSMASGELPQEFVCADPALARLVHYLRVLDIDVAFYLDQGSHRADVGKVQRLEEISKLRELMTSGNVNTVLTTSPRVAEIMRYRTYRFQTRSVDEQFWETLAVFGIDARTRAQLSLNRRCHLCNAGLVSVGRNHVIDNCFKTSDERDVYHLCTNSACEMKYWHSKTYCGLREEVLKLVAEAWF